MTFENLCEPSPILAPLVEILCEPRRLWRHGSRAPDTMNFNRTVTIFFPVLFDQYLRSVLKTDVIDSQFAYQHID